jgi:hydroxymethylpyrimidine/phosphomethylpyrimidine kinase
LLFISGIGQPEIKPDSKKVDMSSLFENKMNASPPAVLTLSGHDPCGGAGIQADIEAIAHFRCHAVSVITALTEQDSRNVKRVLPQTPENIINQALTVLADIPVKAIKIGLLGHPDIARSVHAILKERPDIPVVFDPVLAAGGGAELADNELIAAINELLLPRTTLLTPNSMEARRLTGLIDLQQCGAELSDKGCTYVLITGTHEATNTVCNQLFHARQPLMTYDWERLPFSYHGSGCTLASSIAALLALGADPVSAAEKAQDYTWQTLKSGFKPGLGQHLPNRIYPQGKG